MMSDQYIVNHHPDTLLANFKFADEHDQPTGETLPEHLVQQLDEWQQEARKEHTPVATDLVCHGQTVFMRAHGSGVFSWLLYTDEVRFEMGHGNMQGRVFCRARLSSHLLHMVGALGALKCVETMLSEWMGGCYHEQMSELHLCVDIANWDLTALNPHQDFVSRVVRIRERPLLPEEHELEGGLSASDVAQLEKRVEQHIHEGVHEPLIESNHRKIATIDFGSHGSAISCQIYNKLAEVKKRKKEWFYPIWQANGWDGVAPVTRVEFRFKRKFFQEFDLNEAHDVLSQLHLLWRYATEQWLRYVDRSVSVSNTSRYPTQPVWELIQSAYDLAPGRVTRDHAGEQAMRFDQAVYERPLEVLKQAVTLASCEEIEQDERDFLTVDDARYLAVAQTGLYSRLLLSCAFLSWLCEQYQAVLWSKVDENFTEIERTLRDEPHEVLRDLAHEQIQGLSERGRQQLLDQFSSLPFQEVQEQLIRRERRMSRQKANIAAAVGNLRSAVALTSPEEFACSRAGQTVAQRTIPDLFSSVLWLYDQAIAYDKQKGRYHNEEIYKKRLGYGFVTAAQISKEKRMYGTDLLKEDWLSIDRALDDLRLAAKKRKKQSDSDGSVFENGDIA